MTETLDHTFLVLLLKVLLLSSLVVFVLLVGAESFLSFDCFADVGMFDKSSPSALR